MNATNSRLFENGVASGAELFDKTTEACTPEMVQRAIHEVRSETLNTAQQLVLTGMSVGIALKKQGEQQ